jgi:predicted phosphoribosyltransferase
VKHAFRDRQAAGARLAGMLERYRDSDAVVLAIPAGGVPVGAAIAKALGLQLQVAPVSKVLFPWTTEGGYGAVAFDGSVWIDEGAVENYGLKPE